MLVELAEALVAWLRDVLGTLLFGVSGIDPAADAYYLPGSGFSDLEPALNNGTPRLSPTVPTNAPATV